MPIQGLHVYWSTLYITQYIIPILNHLQLNSLNISQLQPCMTYQITVTPKMANNVSGLSAKTEATVIPEGTLTILYK